jgi:hypothetical protein
MRLAKRFLIALATLALTVAAITTARADNPPNSKCNPKAKPQCVKSGSQ